jgi:hypothetical protein
MTHNGQSNYDLALYIFEGPANDCEAHAKQPISRCAGAADDNALGLFETVSYANEKSEDQEIYLLVDSWFARGQTSPDQSFGTFALETRLDAVPQGDTCATAIELVPGVVTGTQSLSGFSDDYRHSTPTCRVFAGADAVYKL